MKCIDFLEAIGRELTKHSFVCTMYIFKSGKMKCNKFWKYGICRALTESLFVRTHKTCCRTIFGFFFKKRNICGIACGLERLRCVGYQYWERLMSVDFDHLSFFKIVTFNPTLSLFFMVRGYIQGKRPLEGRTLQFPAPQTKLFTRDPVVGLPPAIPHSQRPWKKGGGKLCGKWPSGEKSKDPPTLPPLSLAAGGRPWRQPSEIEKGPPSAERGKKAYWPCTKAKERERERRTEGGGWRPYIDTILPKQKMKCF